MNNILHDLVISTFIAGVVGLAWALTGTFNTWVALGIWTTWGALVMFRALHAARSHLDTSNANE